MVSLINQTRSKDFILFSFIYTRIIFLYTDKNKMVIDASIFNKNVIIQLSVQHNFL